MAGLLAIEATNAYPDRPSRSPASHLCELKLYIAIEFVSLAQVRSAAPKKTEFVERGFNRYVFATQAVPVSKLWPLHGVRGLLKTTAVDGSESCPNAGQCIKIAMSVAQRSWQRVNASYVISMTSATLSGSDDQGDPPPSRDQACVAMGQLLAAVVKFIAQHGTQAQGGQRFGPRIVSNLIGFWWRCQSSANSSLHDGDRSLMFSAQAAI